MEPVIVIGAGLAGSEAAWQLAQRGIPVQLREMKPHKMTPAHHSPDFGELVCSNSLRSDQLENAVGLLKEELRRLKSLILTCAEANRVEAGGALAVAFYLRIARLLAPYIGRSRLALTLSRNTFAIMMHHYMGFFALNCVFLALNASGLGAADFSVRSFRTMSNYMYAPGGKTEWDVIYLLCGLLLPLGIEWACQKLLRVLRRR